MHFECAVTYFSTKMDIFCVQILKCILFPITVYRGIPHSTIHVSVVSCDKGRLTRVYIAATFERRTLNV